MRAGVVGQLPHSAVQHTSGDDLSDSVAQQLVAGLVEVTTGVDIQRRWVVEEDRCEVGEGDTSSVSSLQQKLQAL